MSTVKAVFADPNIPEHLAIRDAAASVPAPAEALVRVAAMSLNRGETRRALQTDTVWRPGGISPASSNTRLPMVPGHKRAPRWWDYYARVRGLSALQCRRMRSQHCPRQ